MIVTIKNRSGDTITFEELSENVYKFDSSFKMGWRRGYNDDGSIGMIDPPGGPYITVGYIIPDVNKEVVNIESGVNGVILKTK